MGESALSSRRRTAFLLLGDDDRLLVSVAAKNPLEGVRVRGGFRLVQRFLKKRMELLVRIIRVVRSLLFVRFVRLTPPHALANADLSPT